MAEIQNIKIANVECVEIHVTVGRTKYFLTDIAESIKGKKIVDIIHVNENMVKFSPSQSPMLADSSRHCFLTLSSHQKEIVKDYSFSLLDPKLIRPSFNNLTPDWSKSFVTISNSGIINSPCSILLYVMFND